MLLRKEIKKDFTVVHNAFIRDNRLSYDAKGLLLVMLSQPDNWNFSIAGLASDKLTPDGETKVRTTLNKLKAAGYLKVTRITNEKGQIIDWEYSFSDEPIFQDENNTDKNNKKSNKRGTRKQSDDEKPVVENPQLDKPQQEKPVVENPTNNKILSNQVLSNQLLSNQSSFNQSAADNKTKDGQTDGQQTKESFSDTLKAIDYDWEKSRLIDCKPESEKDFRKYNEGYREVWKCTLPYSMKDKKSVKETLKFLFAYSYYADKFKPDSKRLMEAVINSITALITTEKQIIDRQNVTSEEVIDRLNEILHNNGEITLNDWFNSFEKKWSKIISENNIKNPKAYMKSCIWNWLNDFQFEEDNELRLMENDDDYSCLINQF